VEAGTTKSIGRLEFQLNRWDLYQIVRLTASARPFRKVAGPALVGFVFLGHAIDGNYLKGSVWAIAVGALFWGISNIMFLLHVYGGGNETLLVPQVLTLYMDRVVVESEHSREEFERPNPGHVKVHERHLIITREERDRLIFLRSSFPEPGDFETLKTWVSKSGDQ
jgi:hypothetical protein